MRKLSETMGESKNYKCCNWEQRTLIKQLVRLLDSNILDNTRCCVIC